MTNINLNNYEAFLLDYFESNLNESEVLALKEFLLLHPELEIDLEDSQLPELTNNNIQFQSKRELKKQELYLEDEEIINYIENRLNPENQKHFEQRMVADKVFEKDVLNYKKTLLPVEAEIIYPFKTSLVKTEEDLVLTNPVLNYIENMLTSTERKAFEAELLLNPYLNEALTGYSATRLKPEFQIVYPDKAGLKKENSVIPLFSFRNVAAMAAALLLLMGLVVVFQFYTTKEEKGFSQRKIERVQPPATNPKITALPQLKVNIVNKAGAVLPLAEKKKIKVNNSEPTKKELNQSSLKEELQLVQEKEIEKILPVETKVIPEDPISSVGLAQNSGLLNNTSFLIPFEEEFNEEENQDNTEVKKQKKGFWGFMAGIAKRANKLGIKSLDGNEINENHYLLSFNSFSVEKK